LSEFYLHYHLSLLHVFILVYAKRVTHVFCQSNVVGHPFSNIDAAFEETCVDVITPTQNSAALLFREKTNTALTIVGLPIAIV